MVESRAGTVYFEHVRVGQIMKVAAVCGETGTEVFVMGPLNASPRDLEKLALRKLERRLAEERGEGG